MKEKQLKLFNWTAEQKEVFFKAAERTIKEDGMDSEISIDRTTFAIKYSDDSVCAKVYLKPLERKGKAKMWSRIKEIPGVFDETRRKRKAVGCIEKDMFYRGCFIFPLNEYGFYYQ